MPRVDLGGGSVGLAVSPAFSIRLASGDGSVHIGASEVSFAPDTGERVAMIAASATFSPVVQIVQERGATITASATITAVTGVDFADRLANIAAAATVAPVVEVVQERAASISAAASVAPVGQVVREVSASITAAATVSPVTGSGEVASRSATVTVTATFSPVVQIVQERGATITATATVSPVGEDGATGGAFDPTDLGAKLVTWIDFADATTLAVNADGTGGQPTSGADFAFAADKSTNAHDATWPGTVTKPAFSGSLAEFRGTDRFHVPLGASRSSLDFFMVMDGFSNNANILCATASTRNFIIWQTGSPSGAFDGIVIRDVYVDGGLELLAANNPTRGDLYTAAANRKVIFRMSGMDLSSSGFDSGLRIGQLQINGADNGTFQTDMDIYDIVVGDNLSAQEISDVESYLADKHSITLA